MITIAILLLFLCGFFIISRISTEFTLTERIGFAFPIGLACVTFLMMLRDWAGMSITSSSSMSITTILVLLAAASLISIRKEFFASLKPKTDHSWFNLLWLLLLVILVYVEYANYTKTMFFPVYDRDSMAGFDTIGYIAAQEHTYKGLSIFAGDYMPKIHQAGSCISYIPMLQLSYAYIYSLGAETSKIIPALFYISFIIGFYGLACRATNHTAAMLATLATVFTPEMLSFSSLSITNVMQATMASTGLLYVTLWCKTEKRRDLLLGAALIAVNCWLRAEGIVFGGAAGILVLIQCLRKKTSWLTLIIPLATLLPTVLFSMYASASGLTSESALITHIYWDSEKASTIWTGAWALFKTTTFYGWAFLLLFLAFLANIYYTIKERDNLFVLGALILSAFLYYLVLYHVDYKWDSLNNVLAYSAKRFMFCFVPMAWYYIVTCHISRRGFRWIEHTCGIAEHK